MYSYTDNGSFQVVEYNKGAGAEAVQLSDKWDHNKKYKQYVAIGKGATVGVASKPNDVGMVAIGYGSSAFGSEAIALGKLAKTKEGAGQAIAIGSNSGANSQSVALGSDVFALGKSSVAIGNDDIDNDQFNDMLPEETIKLIFKDLISDKSYFDNDLFNQKYLQKKNGKDNRIYSPTYAAGIGAIAIGSRAVAAGNLSTSVGALSFALADYSTTMGMRAFVGQNATGGVAIGQESRVFAANSLSIGNFNEATSNGSMSYGYNARAVGEHTIAIGSMVAAGARFNVDKGGKWLELYKTFNKNQTDLDEIAEFDKKADDILKNGNNSEVMPVDYENGTILTIGKNNIRKTQQHGETGNGKNAIVIGGRSFALWENSLALGYSALADASNGFAIGSYAYAGNRATNAMAIGVRSYAEGVNSIALGYRARVQDESNNTIAGKNDQNKDHYKGTNSIALGIESLAYLNNSVALGHQSKTDYLYNDLLHDPYTPKGSITIPTSAQSGVISVGSKGQERRVVNVASGYLDTDAANVGQLKSLEERVNLLTSGGAGFNAPYLAVDQTSERSEAKRITDGQKAVQNYERYVELAKQYATLLNRKANGKETFNQQSLNLIKDEVKKLGENNKIATTASTITNAITELEKLQSGAQSNTSDQELKKKFDEWQEKISKAVTADNTEDKKRQLTSLTEEEIKASNFNSNRAEGQDSIAFGFKANTDKKAEHAIAIGYNATAKGIGAVAIGDSAVVEENAGDSVALGKNSKAEAKKTALSSAEIPSGNGKGGIKFSWTGAGTSQNQNGAKDKAVVSVGTQGSERLITHVAAGEVTQTSTDAINGGQLYGVASVFSTMATGILGLEANNGSDGFKNATFAKLKDEKGQDTSVQAPTTFKQAIDKNIETINKGLKFMGNTGNSFTKQLGATVTIKGDGTDLTSNATDGTISFTLNKETNITQNASSTKVPTTKAVKEYIDEKVQGVSSTLDLEADNSNGSTYGKVELKTQKLNIKGKENEIKTSVTQNEQTVTISLDEAFTNKVTAIETNVTKNTSDIKTVTDKVTKNTADIKTVTDKATQNENKIQEVGSKADKNAEDIKNQEIAYKANGDQKPQKVKLSDGLVFNGDTNITVEAKDKGAITHKLNSALKGISSIAKNTDGNGAKITLNENDITVNKKITGLVDGSIEANSKDAVTGGQLHKKLAEKADKTLGNIDQDGKDVVSKLAVEAIKAEKEPKTSSALTVEAKASENGKSKTIKVGLNETTLISNLSSGANITTPNNGAPKLVTDKQVSDFIGGKTLTFKDHNGGSHASKLDSEFKLVGNDDITITVSSENSNGKATFVLNKVKTIDDNTPKGDDNDKVATAGAVKTYVDNALTTAKTEADKTAVKYDDDSKNAITLGGKDTQHPPVEINNLRSGLGIDEINDSGIASATQGKTRELVKDLVDGKLDTSSHKAANVSDLKAVATAGLNFAGNDSDRLVHKNLGETLQIAGQGVKKEQVAAFNGTDNNILVKTVDNKRLEIALNAQLTGLQSATFTKDQKTVEITGDKIVLKDSKDGTNGNSATYTADSATLTDKDGNTAKLNGQSLTVGDKNASNGDKTHSVYGKDGLTIHGKDGESAVSLTTKNDNGKDAATLAFAKDGDKGTGTITGLKDLADDADGSSATNKNYVDNQLKKAKEDADKTAVKYDDETRNVITLGGKGTSHKPVVIDNLRSGLGIDDIQGVPNSAKQGKTVELVKKLVAGELDKDFSHKAANVSDLKALAIAGLNFAGNDAKDIHKNLGETLTIVGQGVSDIALFKGTDNNIAVKTVAGNLEVSLNEALTAIKSLVTQAKPVDGNAGLSAISTLDGAGLHLTPAEGSTNGQGKQADYGLLGSTLKDGEKTNTQTAGSITLAQGDSKNMATATENTLVAKDAEDPTATLTNKQTAAGNTLSDDKGNRATYDRHGVSLQDKEGNTAKLDAQGLTVGDKDASNGDKTHATYGKNGLTVYGKDGQSAVSLTTKNTNGKDAATLEFAKGEDGQAGTGAITGLKDLEANADGSSAANKNYVDAQLSSALEEVAGNRPFDYYLNDIKVSKDKDGKFYKENNGQKVELSAEEKAQVVIKAEPQSTPMTVSNIKAAELAENSTDAVNGAQLVAATGALAGQDGKMTFADGRDGKAATDPTAAANQGLTAKDGLNGHNANDKANALRNGEAGTVIYTDSAGQRLVKANDGKYYHAADVGRDGEPKGGKSAVENPQLSLVNAQGNTDKAALLGNVASGLGVKTPTA
ncbi:MAG: hypothetical protein SOX56_03680, partial [[Pasteurella] mairii]|nr:hypothetical protein [[Pasteurella] mairii]